jgi:NADH:ubiquinone oxidoreductase subunit F (NADH-binding)
LNNVETFANVPLIINQGADWFAAIGTERSKGTKVFALTGKVKNTGLVEVPMGITLKELIFDIGGGIIDDKKFKAAQTGGPSGGCVFTGQLDLQMDYESLKEAGSMMGSGGLVIMDEMTCMVDVARFFTSFNMDESCGKCSTCRLGTQRMLEILDRICAGEGHPHDIEVLETLGTLMYKTTLCGLGQTAPNPVLSTIRYFREEYEAHIHERRCPAKVCKALISYRVIEENCPGCMVCARRCPVGAVSGEKKAVHHIDPEACIKCGACFTACKFDAIAID